MSKEKTPKESKSVYLHLAIAQSGYSSRRKAEGMVRAGKVKVNNRVITIPEYRIIPEKDTISINGKALEFKEKKVYFLLNKPKGVLSAVSDKRRQKTVIDLLPAGVNSRVYPVGRLDKDTTGLLILTNDGELNFRLTHPNFKVPKTYFVICEGHIDKTKIAKLEKGIDLEGKKTLPAEIKNKKFNKKQNKSSLLIEIFEGRKRQIKKMFQATGHRVAELKRIKYAGLTLGALKEGQIRPLTEDEINRLKEITGLKI